MNKITAVSDGDSLAKQRFVTGDLSYSNGCNVHMAE